MTVIIGSSWILAQVFLQASEGPSMADFTGQHLRHHLSTVSCAVVRGRMIALSRPSIAASTHVSAAAMASVVACVVVSPVPL